MMFLSQLQSGEEKHGLLYEYSGKMGYYGRRGDMKSPRVACMTEVR